VPVGWDLVASASMMGVMDGDNRALSGVNGLEYVMR